MIKISVITVCYNAELSIEDTIKSVLNQTYDNIEYLIIDGESTDSTLKKIDLLKNPKIKVYSEPDFGIYNAMNRGIARASGDYIYFINAGDVISSSNVFEEVVNVITDTNTIYYGYVEKTRPGEVGKIRDYSLIEGTWEEKMLIGYMPCHQAIFAPTSLLRSHYFDESYKLRADFKWFYQCMVENHRFEYMPIEIAKYDMRGESAAISSEHLMEDETIRAAAYCLRFIRDLDLDSLRKVKVEGEWESKARKHLDMVKILIKWLSLYEHNIKITSYFEKQGYYNIAIYGMGYIGEKLLLTLEDSNINVDFVVDKKKLDIVTRVPVFQSDDEFPQTQCIVVTAFSFFDEIENSISDKVKCNIVSIEEVIDECFNMI